MVRTHLQRLPLYLLLLIMPLAVAGQNIGTGVIALMLFAQIGSDYSAVGVRSHLRQFAVPLTLGCGYLLLLAVATLANPANPARTNLAPVGGHVLWCFLPLAVVMAQGRLSARDWRWLGRVLAFVAVVMGVMAATQMVWRWRLIGSHFGVPEMAWHLPPRAQGLYSHPLSFAYVGLVWFPLSLAAVTRWPRLLTTWVAALGFLVALLASGSRVAQIIAVGMIAFSVLRATKGRRRVALLAAAGAVVSIVLLTNNPIGERLRGTLERHDVRSDYADDRVAFWHANILMFMDRPVLGHGEHLDKSYRHPYYERIGLGDFERQYEAHNMYLQWAVNGGVIGLLLMLAYLAWHGRALLRLRSLGTPLASAASTLGAPTMIAFLLGALTQNALQDSVVRYSATLATCALWLVLRQEAGLSGPPRLAPEARC